MTIYDADERFWMSIRPQNGTFYDEDSAINIYAAAAGGAGTLTVGREKFTGQRQRQ